MTTHELRFPVTPEKGEVSALLDCPEGARALLVLGHGSGSNMRHPFIVRLSEALVDAGVATFRYQYPYSERGGGGLDSRDVLLTTVRHAVAAAAAAAPDLPLFAGGHSMSGRMTSLACAEAPLPQVKGIVFAAFPLNGGKGPLERAAHFAEVHVPMLFLQGDRDPLADIDGIRSVCARLGDRATLHVVETADHGFKVQKRSGKTHEQVIAELAGVIAGWMDRHR
jgi:predicted alpha/beta-hydrolase family hydrolase